MKGRLKDANMQTQRYLLHHTSSLRSIILTISMIALYFFLSIIIKKIFYFFVEKDSYIYISPKYFFVFFCITTLPVFCFLFLKFNIWTTFWDKTERPHIIDYLFFGVILFFLYISFNHPDITQTSVHGKILLDMTWRGMNILDFYEYNRGTAVYLLPQYILFGIWSIPVKLGYMLSGLPPIDINEFHRIIGVTLWWYKLLPTLFYFGTAFMIYKIGILLGLNDDKAKWMSFVWLIFPVASFSQFIFGQYDSVGLFFELLMIYYFLQKKLLKASLICMVAVTFKVFPIFVFLPLLLLFEKKPLKIIVYFILAISGYVFFTRIFESSTAFRLSGEFNKVMLYRLLNTGIDTSFGVIAFFLITFIIVCVFVCFIKIENKDELSLQRYILYIPLFVYSSFFSFVSFHPQWILILTPYLVFNIFVNRRPKGFMFIAIAVSVSFLLQVMSWWSRNVDANLINLGFFPMLFGFNNTGEAFKSLVPLITMKGLVPQSMYFSVFVGMLIVNLILSFPSSKNIRSSRNDLLESFTIERDVVWINGMVVLLFSIPSVLLFFTQGLKTVDKIISELPLLRSIETLTQNTNDIVSVDIIDGNMILKCGTYDPFVVLPLQSSLEKPAGSPFIEITYTNSNNGRLQVFFDYGSWYSEENSVSRQIAATADEINVRLPVVGWQEGQRLVGIRIDPPDGTQFMVKNIKVLSAEEVQ